MVRGILGKKLGMSRMFTDAGRWIPVTLLEAGPCTVIQRKTEDSDGYSCVQLGYDDIREKLLTKPRRGHFAKNGLPLKRILREFPVDAASELKVGDEIKVDLFNVGERVDVSGTTKGKGFAGVQKRHHFQGGPGSHGSHFHRRPGSIGQSANPGHVFKGLGMPGHMGNVRRTAQNLEIIQVDAEKNVIVVRGCVPGANGTVVEVRKSVKGS